MNFYKISFNPKISEAFNMFRGLVKMKYGQNAWSSDADHFYLVATPSPLEEVRKYVDVSIDPDGSKLPGAADLGLEIASIGPDEQGLPESARTWLTAKVQAVTALTDILRQHDKSE
jgi:hypothetical protein